jgi:hypothetical protein
MEDDRLETTRELDDQSHPLLPRTLSIHSSKIHFFSAVVILLTKSKANVLMCRKFEPRVSFDTFEKKGESVYTSFSLNRKHVDFKATKGTRTFLCGIDDNDYSYYALEWLIDEMVDDGDEIVCLRVVDKDSTIANSASLEERNYRREADALMASIQEKNHENKAINLVLEFAVGKVEKVIMATVCACPPVTVCLLLNSFRFVYMSQPFWSWERAAAIDLAFKACYREASPNSVCKTLPSPSSL